MFAGDLRNLVEIFYFSCVGLKLLLQAETTARRASLSAEGGQTALQTATAANAALEEKIQHLSDQVRLAFSAALPWAGLRC